MDDETFSAAHGELVAKWSPTYPCPQLKVGAYEDRIFCAHDTGHLLRHMVFAIQKQPHFGLAASMTASRVSIQRAPVCNPSY
ncbi:hypothetical protein GOP47_0029919 [Adiantum capillus-veneris]|nr:hypothetical protein GOP47_0029919 [Adiantum capillus-veneris]